MNSSHSDSKQTLLKKYTLMLVIATIILGYSALTADYSYAQKLSPSTPSSNDNISNSSNNNNTQQIRKEPFGENVQKNQQSPELEQQQQSQALPSVKITSHTQNQQVPAGALTINGISSDTPSDICTVYIVLNNVKPYQKVTPISMEKGQGSSQNDFSTWNYTFTPQYAIIKEGTNKMTSKISCDALATGISNTNSNLTKFNSLNITGITTDNSSGSNGNSTQLIRHLSNVTSSSDSPVPQPTTYNISQNAIYSPITPSPSTASPLSNNVVEEEDNEIQSLNKQDKEIEIESDETTENDNDNSDRSRAREVFEVVEERLRDSGIDFDISNMLD
jgi:hypothetical protein